MLNLINLYKISRVIINRTIKKPLIGISTNELTNFNGRQVSHSTGLRYVNAVANFTNGIPILIPSNIKGNDLDELLRKD